MASAAQKEAHAFFERQAESAAEAASKAPSDQVVTHSLSLDPQEGAASVQREVDEFMKDQSQRAAAAEKMTSSDSSLDSGAPKKDSVA